MGGGNPALFQGAVAETGLGRGGRERKGEGVGGSNANCDTFLKV